MGRGTIHFHHSLARSFRTLPPLILLLSLAAIFVPAASAQSAAAWSKRGRQAELREDYDAAFEGYRQAHLKKPGDLRYKTEFERMRFQAGAQHIDRGRVLRQNSDSSGALAQFLRAYQIDPSNQTAQQEIAITENPGNYVTPPADGPVGATPTTPGTAPTSPPANTQTPKPGDILSGLDTISGMVQLQPVSNDPITLHMVEDVKVIYQAIGKAAGLNTLFDPDYTSKRIPIDLTSVSLSDALHIVGTIAGTFYKPVTPNTIFVAQNTRTKRNELDEMAVQTFYLTNAAQANDANEIMTGLRNLLDPTTKIYLVPSQNAIVMRATEDQLLLAQKLLNDLDRARPEVVVDVAVLEVNKDHIRNLGITLPTSIGLTPQISSLTGTTTTATGTTPVAGAATTTNTSSNFTLNTLSHLNATNFAVNISGGTLNALLTDSDTRILQNPRIRATDGQRATLKIGSKIPVATGSYNAGAATGIGAGIGVQTQFTYLDVGVNIDMTPTVHFDREVSLKMKIEVSSQNGSVTISGVTEPIISQRVIEQVIQLKEGEPSILAGILQKQDNRNTTGTPGLGELPLLKYFFGSQYKETQQDEVVFLLIPHIVRESVLTQLNTRAIDTGTSSSIELRHDAASAATANLVSPGSSRSRATPGNTTAANAAAAMVEQMKQQAAPPTAPPAASPQATPISLVVTPADSTQAVGSTFRTTVMLLNGLDVAATPIELTYNPKVLQVVSVDAGTFLGKDGQAVALSQSDLGNGVVGITASRPPNASGLGGHGDLLSVTFKAIAAGDSSVALSRVSARSSTQASLPVVGSQAVVHVK